MVPLEDGFNRLVQWSVDARLDQREDAECDERPSRDQRKQLADGERARTHDLDGLVLSHDDSIVILESIFGLISGDAIVANNAVVVDRPPVVVDGRASNPGPLSRGVIDQEALLVSTRVSIQVAALLVDATPFVGPMRSSSVRPCCNSSSVCDGRCPI